LFVTYILIKNVFIMSIIRTDVNSGGLLPLLPPAAAREVKEFFGDTPNPGKGLCPLHSLPDKRLPRVSMILEPRQGTKSPAPLIYEKTSEKDAQHICHFFLTC
jgi:hypothetical protein